MENVEFDNKGKIKRSLSPNQILEKFDPLPSYRTL